MKPAKPLYRDPCNGCGLCCIMEQCDLSFAAFGEVPRCLALIDAGGRYACGLIVHPETYFTPEYATEGVMLAGTVLGIGTYCDAIETEADEAVARSRGERFP